MEHQRSAGRRLKLDLQCVIKRLNYCRGPRPCRTWRCAAGKLTRRHSVATGKSWVCANCKSRAIICAVRWSPGCLADVCKLGTQFSSETVTTPLLNFSEGRCNVFWNYDIWFVSVMAFSLWEMQSIQAAWALCRELRTWSWADKWALM
jgi:hypothetical protein